MDRRKELKAERLDELAELEKHWLDKLRPYGDAGYNIPRQ
jgi:hypothetical protein